MVGILSTEPRSKVRIAKPHIHDVRSERIGLARVRLDGARQAHMVALMEAVEAGTAVEELEHDVEAFASAAHQLPGLVYCNG